MICPKCNQLIREDKLVCECFTRQADQEQEELSVRRFLNRDGFLFLTDSRHLLPTRGNAVTLCGAKRLKAPKVTTIWLTQFPSLESGQGFCQGCIKKVRNFIDQASAGLSPEPSERS